MTCLFCLFISCAISDHASASGNVMAVFFLSHVYGDMTIWTCHFPFQGIRLTFLLPPLRVMPINVEWAPCARAYFVCFFLFFGSETSPCCTTLSLRVCPPLPLF